MTIGLYGLHSRGSLRLALITWLRRATGAPRALVNIAKLRRMVASLADVHPNAFVVPSMADLYSTKSLGRVWAPTSPSSPSPCVASKGRFDAQTASSSSSLKDVRLFRGRPAERLGLAVCLLTLIVYLACRKPNLHLPNTSGFGHIFGHLRLEEEEGP